MIEFYPYMYKIKYINKHLEKKYNEFLTQEEIDQIVSESVKATFEEIKKQSAESQT